MDDDLIAFIKARLDEDEAIARAAGQDDLARTWTGNDNGYRGGGQVTDGHGEKVVYDEGAPDTAQALHIARHDPARARREVEAGRRIMARYEDCLDRMEDPEYPASIARDQAREYEDFVLPNLAMAWSSHPEYRREWRP